MSQDSIFKKNLQGPQRDELLNRLKAKCVLTAFKKKDEHFSLEKPSGFIQQVRGHLDSFVRVNVSIPPPKKKEVQIKAKAIGINFRDLMIAMNLYPEQVGGRLDVMGSDYAGIVVACGEEVTQYRIGDKVTALVLGTTGVEVEFCTHVNVDEDAVIPIPSHINFCEAATIPTVFLSAYFSLCSLGKLGKGESVLIHTASGGVGLAAIQFAKLKEANIFVTAGSIEKRNYLESIGCTQPMDSRTHSFSEEIRARTRGEGVDVILNTLSGDNILFGLASLNTFGRFIHIDKKDVFQNKTIPLSYFKKGVQFSFFDITLYFERGEWLYPGVEELSCLFASRQLQPLPYNLFPIEQLDQALKWMATFKHIGKIVLVME